MSDIRNFFKKIPSTNKKRPREQDEDVVEPKPIVNKKPSEKVLPTVTKPIPDTSPPKKMKIKEADPLEKKKPGEKVVPTVTKPVPEASPPKKMKLKEVDPFEKKKRVESYKSFMNRGGPDAPGSKIIPDGEKNCLKDLAFVISGVLESLERDECKKLIEKYGGRVTTAISGKTNYLLTGRDVSEGKITKAKEIKIKIISEDDLLEMIRTRPGDEESSSVKSKRNSKPTIDPDQASESTSIKLKRNSSAASKTTESSSTKLKRNSSSNGKKTTDSNPRPISKVSDDESSLLWVDKYKPDTIKQLVGQQGDKSCVQKLVVWLRDWYKHHGDSNEKIKAKPSFGFNRNENPAMFKAALLSGPPGIGKTTAAQIVCKYLNFEYIEKNASDQRSKKSMTNLTSDTYSVAHFTNKSMSKYVLIMDEVDGVSGNEDRGGIQELISLIKRSRIPIICICNDRQHKKIRSLANYCYDLRFHRPT
ncbi:unnamed protein product, partial [Adineta steineri]